MPINPTFQLLPHLPFIYPNLYIYPYDIQPNNNNNGNLKPILNDQNNNPIDSDNNNTIFFENKPAFQGYVFFFKTQIRV